MADDNNNNNNNNSDEAVATEEESASANASAEASAAYNAFLHSPVPLSAGEADSEAVRALAGRLAPALAEADELLRVPPEFLPSRQVSQAGDSSHNNHNAYNDDDDDDDDSMDYEVAHLGQSEELLRRELELMAQDFTNLFSYDDEDDENDDNEFGERDNNDDNNNSARQQRQQFDATASSFQTPQRHENKVVDRDYDNDDGAEVDVPIVVENEETTTTVSPRKALPPIRIPPVTTPSSHKPTPTASASSASSAATILSPSDSLFAHHRRAGSIHYTPQDHARAIGLRLHDGGAGGWYSVSLARHLLLLSLEQQQSEQRQSEQQQQEDDNSSTIHRIPDAVREYCVAIPEVKLRQMFVGLPEPIRRVPTSRTDSSPPKTVPAEALPVRCICIRIRPDVLVGAVLEAVHHALTELRCALILKRQGGHCQAVICETKYVATAGGAISDNSNISDDDYGVDHDVVDGNETTTSATTRTTIYRPFFVDVRLVTRKSDACERVLLVRVYHSGSVQVQADDPAASPSREELRADYDGPELLDEPVDERAARHLRESAALIQRMEAAASGAATKKINGTPRHMRRRDIERLVSTHLLQHYRACPSVTEGGITLPALNADDYRVIHSSWRLTRALWEELETRDLTYTTLQTCRFGAFPALPTLDVHYCSQLRRLSREAMVRQLLKAAAELEEFAREAELECASMITLLRPAFESYHVEAPSLPRATSLTEYPLDFVPPTARNPPFGSAVQHALNEVQALTSQAGIDAHEEPFTVTLPTTSPTRSNVDAEQSLTMAADAVQRVMNAFRKQDDDEQSARLVRKNVQCMDRLAKMQAHQKLSIQILEQSRLQSAAAARAAEAFEKRTGVANEVPLLKWGVVVGRATGTCTVTARHVAFVTQLIPVLGGNTVTVFPLEDVEFSVQEEEVSILNPLPTVITVTQRGNEVYSFRPSIGGARLKSFLDGVRAAALLREPLTLPDNPSSRISLTEPGPEEEIGAA